MENNDFEDDDIPGVPPEFRARYVKALGEYSLAFNQMDYVLGELIKSLLKDMGQESHWKDVCENFGKKLKEIDRLKNTTKGYRISSIDVDKLRGISGERAKIAHAHMELDYVDKAYKLIWKGDVIGDEETYSAEKVETLAEEIRELGRDLVGARVFDIR